MAGTENVTKQLVRSVPFQACQELVGQVVQPGAFLTSRSFDVTSFLTDRNQFNPTTTPDASACTCAGFFADCFLFSTQPGTLFFRLGINGSASWRNRPTDQFFFIANTLIVQQAYRIPASYFSCQVQNTSGVAATIDFAVYLRSL